MPLVRLDRFGFAGLNADLPPTLLEAGEWSTLQNIDIENGCIRSPWGDHLVTAYPPVTPSYSHVFVGSAGTYLVISDGSEIWVYDGTSWEDITPSSTTPTTLTWADYSGTDWTAATEGWSDTETGATPITVSGDVFFTDFLGTLVMSSEGGIPCYWPGESGRMTGLPGWNAAWRAAPVFAYLNHLVALNYDDGSVAGPQYRLAWSDAAAEGEIPQVWVPTALNLAGSVQLRDSDGFLVTAKILRDDLVIYKNDSIYRMFPRNDEIVFGFERVISDHGCDSPWGVDAVGDGLIFADRGDLRIYDGQTTRSIAALKVRTELSAGISDEYRDRTIVLFYPEVEQVWIGVVPAGDTAVQKVLVLDLVHQAWSIKDYHDVLSMCLGPFSITEETGTFTWDDLSGTFWNTIEDSWWTGLRTPTEDGVIFGMSSGIVRADKSNTDVNGAAKYCYAERRGYRFADLDQAVTIVGVYPEIEGNAEVEIRVGALWEVGGSIRWSPWKTFKPGTDRRIRPRVTGMPCAFAIRSQYASDWKLGAVSFEMVPAARRGRT